MSINLKSGVLVAAIAAALPPIMAVAQDAAAPASQSDQSQSATSQSQAKLAGKKAVAKKADQMEQLEEVVVTGVRQSLKAALNTKRFADSFVDSINSEDVGKLPDANIAAVLQRVPGVTIQRTRGEGDFISIRGLGPNFVRGEIDGRTLVSGTETTEAIRNGGQDESTGRATNFDVLPAEIVKRVDVYKSPTAAMTEGGIGGVVNIVTQNPLELGNHYFLTANGEYRQLNKTVNPDVSGLASWRNEVNTFGILADVSYSKRDIRQDSMDTYGWGTPTNWAAYPDIDSTGSGTPNLLGSKNLSGPWTANVRQDLDTRERATAQVKAAWKLPDDSQLTANALYSRRTADDSALNSTWGIVPNGFVDVPPGLVPPGKSGTNMLGNCGAAGPPPGGFCTVPGTQANGDSFTSIPVTSNGTDTFSQDNQTDSLTQLGLNYRKDFGAFHLDGDLSYSGGRGALLAQFSNVQLAYVTPIVVTNDGKTLQINVAGNPDLSSAGNYYSRGLNEALRKNDQSEKALALNGQLDLNNVPLSSELEFGVRLAERDVNRKVYGDPNGDQNSFLLNGFSGFHPEGNFGGGQFSFPFNQMFYMTPGQLEAALQTLDPTASASLNSSQFQPNPSFEVAEKTNAFYLQDDLDTKVFGMPLKGNVGVRGVWTDESATGYYQPFTIVYNSADLGALQYTSTGISTKDYKSSYFNLLPILNLELNIRPDLLLRFAAGKSLTRPDFATQLAPSLSIINLGNAQGTGRVAAGGNPDLNAYQSTNLDLGLEWYFAPSSALWAAVYDKQIDSFIAQSSSFNVERFGYTWNTFMAPENQGSAKIYGLEFGYQQVFDNGFGFVLNGTLTRSSAEYTHGTLAGQTIPFDGVSKYSYNAEVFYEKKGFNARLAYGYRSEYVILGQDVFGNTLYNDGYGQLDASVSYALNEHWTFVANAVNLTNAANRIYTIKSFDSVAYQLVGRRVGIGVRLKF
jgi:iron complex outermembrane recepter protein